MQKRVTNSALLRRRKAMAQQERRGAPETTGRIRGGGGFLPDIRGPSTQRAAAAAAQRGYSRRPRQVEQQYQRGAQQPPQRQERQVIRQEPRGYGRRPRHQAKASDGRSRKEIEPARRAPREERRRHPAAGQRGTVVVRVRKPKPFCNYRKHNKRLQRSVKSGAYTNDRGLCVRVVRAPPRVAATPRSPPLPSLPPSRSALLLSPTPPRQLSERLPRGGRPHWQRALRLCGRAPAPRRARLRGQVRRRRICRVRSQSCGVAPRGEAAGADARRGAVPRESAVSGGAPRKVDWRRLPRLLIAPSALRAAARLATQRDVQFDFVVALLPPRRRRTLCSSTRNFLAAS